MDSYLLPAVAEHEKLSNLHLLNLDRDRLAHIARKDGQAGSGDRCTREWNLQQICGYFTSWSALQRYREKNGSDPLELVMEDLRRAWGIDPEKTQVVAWPLTVRLARL